MSARPAPVVLRTAAVWGTTVLALRNLRPGQSFQIGDRSGAVLPSPDGIPVSELPVRAIGKGWELDARGATGGIVSIRGQQENPASLAASGAPIPIVAGDFGLLQYDNFGVFFQFTEAPPKLRRRRRLDWGFWLSLMFSTIAVGGALALIFAITTPPPIAKPIALTSQAELLEQLNIKVEAVQSTAAAGKQDAEKKEKKDVAKPGKSAGKTAARSEGATGRRGAAKETELSGQPRLGGMTDALSSEVGDEVRKTLSTIGSVADALGELRSDKIVLGANQGMGLKGSGAGGGGDGPGVPFGAGTLDTGGGAGVAGPDAPKAGQGLSAGQIQRVIMSRMGAFRACYESAAARDPRLTGSLSINFRIAPDGSVSSASVASSSLGNGRVEGCVQRMFTRLKFPKAGKATMAQWPFVFRPSKR